MYWSNKEKPLQIKSYNFYYIRHFYSASCFHNNYYHSNTVLQISLPPLLAVHFTEMYPRSESKSRYQAHKRIVTKICAHNLHRRHFKLDFNSNKCFVGRVETAFFKDLYPWQWTQWSLVFTLFSRVPGHRNA